MTKTPEPKFKNGDDAVIISEGGILPNGEEVKIIAHCGWDKREHTHKYHVESKIDFEETDIVFECNLEVE